MISAFRVGPAANGRGVPGKNDPYILEISGLLGSLTTYHRPDLSRNSFFLFMFNFNFNPFLSERMSSWFLAL